MMSGSKLIPKAWLCVALLWVVACLNYLDRVMLTTMRDSLKEAIPMTDAQFGLLTSVFLWIYGILSPLAGFLADRFSRRGIIIMSLAVWSAITWLTGHARSYDQLLFARALMGISEAFYISAAMALIVDYHRGATRSLASGIHVSGFLVGSGLGGLGGWLAERHGWSYPFNLFGVIGVAYAILLMFLLRDAPREQESVSSPEQNNNPRFVPALKSLLGSGSFLLAIIYWGLLGLAGWAVVGWMPTFFKERFNLGQGTAGLSVTGYLQTAALIGVIAGGALADWWSRKTDRGRIFICITGLCLAAPGILLAIKGSILALSLTGLVIYGLTRSFTDANMMPILCLVTSPRYRATGYGVVNLFACVVGGITVYIGGVLRDAHVESGRIFQFASASLLVCAAILFFIKPSFKPTVEIGSQAKEPSLKSSDELA